MANKMLSSGKLCSKMIYLVTPVSEVDPQVRCSSGVFVKETSYKKDTIEYSYVGIYDIQITFKFEEF